MMTKELDGLNVMLANAMGNGETITVVIETSKMNISYDILVDEYTIDPARKIVSIEGEKSTLEITGEYNMSVYTDEIVFSDPYGSITLMA